MPVPTAVTRWAVRRLLGAVSVLTSPRSPGEYLGLLDPLWSAHHPAGRVAAVRSETPDAATLDIRPGSGWRGHLAGQYLPLGLELDGVWHWRTYSLTCPPGADTLSVTVTAHPGGRVSPHLVHRLRPGTVLRLGPAGGDFTLPDGAAPRLLMVTAGSGLTPVMGLLRTLAQQRDAPDVVLLHSAPTARDSLFRAELRELAAERPWFRLHEQHTRTAGRLTPALIAALCPDWHERETWACGPDPLLDTLEEHWGAAGLAGRLRTERFRPPALLPPTGAGGTGGRVRFQRTGTETESDADTPLLDTGEAAGVRMPYGCRGGLCFGCLTPLVNGKVRDLRTGAVHGEPGQQIQTCVSAASGPLVLDL